MDTKRFSNLILLLLSQNLLWFGSSKLSSENLSSVKTETKNSEKFCWPELSSHKNYAIKRSV